MELGWGGVGVELGAGGVGVGWELEAGRWGWGGCMRWSWWGPTVASYGAATCLLRGTNTWLSWDHNFALTVAILATAWLLWGCYLAEHKSWVSQSRAKCPRRAKYPARKSLRAYEPKTRAWYSNHILESVNPTCQTRISNQAFFNETYAHSAHSKVRAIVKSSSGSKVPFPSWGTLAGPKLVESSLQPTHLGVPRQTLGFKWLSFVPLKPKGSPKRHTHFMNESSHNARVFGRRLVQLQKEGSAFRHKALT